MPVDDSSKADYFDSIHHSAAVVGVNTTAQIESAIVGRRVYTILAPEFRDTQEGTIHFHHLVRAGGGLVHVATDFADHLSQLAGRQSIDKPAYDFVTHLRSSEKVNVPPSDVIVIDGILLFGY